MENKIMTWSYDKPTEPGLYIACRGDVESEQNLSPIKVVEECILDYESSKESNVWPTYSPSCLAKWSGDFKFAKLVIGG